ncbi:hypothetical protein ACPPVW_18595 [Leifsonia sp. McL0607]|uniref:hypothetical protein n=1 Tax=Leifsonia sp. McL0607 TaxID=3415672 RepID=UPI003CEF124F
MTATSSAAHTFGFGAGSTRLDLFVQARAKAASAGYARQWSRAAWQHASDLSVQFTGPGGRQSLPDDGPAAPWLRELCNGDMRPESDAPAPILFRTTYVARAWLSAAAVRSDLTLGTRTGAPATTVLPLLDALERANARIGADVYVYGDGTTYRAVFYSLHADLPACATLANHLPSTWRQFRQRGWQLSWEPPLQEAL